MLLQKGCYVTPLRISLVIWPVNKIGVCASLFQYPSFLIKTDPKRMLLLNNCYKTVSDHFFAICILIFHKTEVKTVILRCLIGLDLNWFKSYGLKCSKTQIFSSLYFCDSVQNHKFAFFVFLGLSHIFCTN